MSGSAHGVSLYARGHVGRVAPVPLRIALAELEKSSAPPDLVDEAWSAAGVAAAIAEAFDEARSIGGRAIVDVTFALHTRLGLSATAPATPYIQLVALDPYMEWLTPRMQSGSPWRRVVGRWVEILNERLTMHRYSSPDYRRLHARDLIAAPIALLAQTEPTNALIDFAENALAFYDLFTADTFAQRGWNRIDLPDADQLGGFYGLADEARPPDPAQIAAMANSLSDSIQPPTIAPALDPWLTQLATIMRESLTTRAMKSSWPRLLIEQTNWFSLLGSLFYRRKI